MANLTPQNRSSRLGGIAASTAVLLEVASLSGCSATPAHVHESPVAGWAWTHGAHQPIRREENGCLWRIWTVENSAVTLIHVRNHHLAGFDSPDAPAAAPFWEAQSQMFTLMVECDKQYPIAALYGDGPTDKFIDRYNRELREQSFALRNNKPDNLRQLLAESSEVLKAQGALAGFAISRGMTFNYGESYELHQRARQARLARAADADDLVLRQREDFLLSRIRADFPKGQVAVMTNFGADHYLWDNIQRWNMTYPDYKISLVEVSAHKVRELGFELPSQLR